MNRLLIFAVLGWLSCSNQQADARQEVQPFPANIRGIAIPNQRFDLKPERSRRGPTPALSTRSGSNSPGFSGPVYLIGGAEFPIGMELPFNGNPTNVYRKPAPLSYQPLEFATGPVTPNTPVQQDVQRFPEAALPVPIASDRDQDPPRPQLEPENAVPDPLTIDLGNDLAASRTDSIGTAISDMPSAEKVAGVTSAVTGSDSEAAGLDVDSQDRIPTQSMKLQVLAPEWMEASRATPLKIEVLNYSLSASSPVTVALKLPAAFTITQLDRDATLDEASRTIRFRIDSIPAGYKQTISLRGVSLVQGQHKLEVALVDDTRQLDQKNLALSVLETSGTLRNANKPATSKR